MRWYWWTGTAIAALLGVFTLLPAAASKPCWLGYYALCSFAPLSTIGCLVVAGAVYWFGQWRARQALGLQEG